MRNIAVIEQKEREALFRNTAAKMGISEAVVEKDFWVCYMLDYLFHRCKWKDSLAFKGGTSLSKAYDLIRRFSEDIDLILDWRLLGYGLDEPWKQRSNTKQDAFNKEANGRAEAFLRDVFLPAIKKDLTEELILPVKCEIDPLDRQTVRFTYPNSFSDTAILQKIRLEIGALADNDLLARVVAFKDKFYRCPWARYDLARRGTMRLMPPEYNISKFRDDYEHMQNMIFGEKPKFDTILSETQKLENDINHIDS